MRRNPLLTPEYYRELYKFHKEHRGAIPPVLPRLKKIIHTRRPESRVMGRRGVASGGIPVAGNRKDVNARSFRKNKPVDDGERAGKAEPVA